MSAFSMQAHDTTLPVLIATKLRPPQLRRDIVHRERLLRKLGEKPGRLVLVVAPPGFGKTTLVLDWLERRPRTSAWLSLEPLDNEPRRFLTYLVAALQSVAPALGARILPLLQAAEAPPLETLVAMLANDLTAWDRELLIILDDYHCIDEPGIHRLVGLVLEYLPPHAHLVVLSRSEPELPLSRQRVRNELTEIRDTELSFTLEEVQDFFARTMKLILSREELRLLAARTEGWVAGLQMAAVSLRDRRDPQDFVRNFTGSHRYLADYLLEEVLSRQSESLQTFLLQTSILSRLHAGLCEAVTGQAEGRRILDAVERANLFLIALDERREWYRYHQLFAELLQARLRLLHPEQVNLLHARASHWFEQHGHFSEAIVHAFEMEHQERALQLLDTHILTIVARTGLAPLMKLIQRVPPASMRGYPTLLIAHAWSQMHQRPHDLDALLQEVETAMAAPALPYTPQRLASLHRQLGIIRAYAWRFQGQLAQAEAAGRQALDELPEEEVLPGVLARFNLARVYMKQGRATAAASLLEQCLADYRQLGSPYANIAVMGDLGVLAADQEGYHQARLKLQTALQHFEQEGLAPLPITGYLLYQLGAVLYELNELAEAGDLLARTVALRDIGHEPNVLCRALLLLAGIHAVRGQPREVHQELAQAGEVYLKHRVRMVDFDLDRERALLALRLGEHQAVAAWAGQHPRHFADDFTVDLETEALILIDLYLHQQRHEQALHLAQWLRDQAAVRDRTNTLLRVDMRAALLAHATGKPTAAFELAATTLHAAPGRGLVRSFLDLGASMQDLLSAFCAGRPGSAAADYARHLLAQFGNQAAARPRPMPKFAQPLPEPLTGREQEVLHYLSLGLSNKEIAAKMFVTLDTIKTHLRHLYGKLGATNRKDALARAQEADLLRPPGNE